MARLENKAQKALRLAMERLPEIVEATLQNNPGYVYMPEDVWSILERKNLVEVNIDLKNEAGEIATRATKEGIETIGSVPQGDKQMSTALKFEIENVPVVVKRTRTGKTSAYPFDILEVGQSFFVPATEAKPEPWKSMAGAVSSANGRFSIPVTNADGTPKMREITRGPNKGELTQETKATRHFVMNKESKEINGIAVDGVRIGRNA